jgi:RNA polymerase sigma-70 factor (ECF subfamily)
VLRSQDDAMDVVQDAFIKAHKYLDKFEGTSSFFTWLYRIVMNLAIDHIRKHRRQRPVDFSEATVNEQNGEVAEDSLLPKLLGGHPERALQDKEIRRRIEAALGELSENHRAVLVMREVEGLVPRAAQHAASTARPHRSPLPGAARGPGLAARGRAGGGARGSQALTRR